jgi:hypothetical protein
VRRLRNRIGVIAIIGALAGGVAAAPATAAADANQTYLIVYQSRAVPADAASRISSAGGILVASYDAIGVAVATSSNAAFRANVKADLRVAEAAATGRTGVRLNDDQATDDAAAQANLPATDGDSLSALQWDMRQIHTPVAHAITGGSPTVVVGDIDTGLDYTHPDLAANVDFSSSVSCIGELRTRARRHGTTTTAMAPTPRARSPRPRTGSGSSGSPRT